MLVRRELPRDLDDARFLKQAEIVETGWRPDLAGIVEAPPPPHR